MLDGLVVSTINPNLSSDLDTTRARRLPENEDIGFVADVKAGAFDIDLTTARNLLGHPSPNGHSNADVLLPWFNGLDVTRRSRSMWIIDFGDAMPLEEAAGYQAPFEYVRKHVKPKCDLVKRDKYRRLWWIHAEPCTRMRDAIRALARYLVTPTLTKHRLFSWVSGHSLPDHQLIAFGRADDYFFGVLHSAAHELWARRMGTQLREVESGFRYTPTTCFETFPLPWPPGKEDVKSAAYGRIAAAAKTLNEQRERWLNPPEWIDPIAAEVDAADKFEDCPRNPARCTPAPKANPRSRVDVAVTIP